MIFTGFPKVGRRKFLQIAGCGTLPGHFLEPVGCCSMHPSSKQTCPSEWCSFSLFIRCNRVSTGQIFVHLSKHNKCCIMEYLSKERYDQIVEELNNLINVEYPRIKEDLSEARAQGDLSENFEYRAARRAQAKTISRIRFLQKVLEYSRVMTRRHCQRTRSLCSARWSSPICLPTSE